MEHASSITRTRARSASALSRARGARGAVARRLRVRARAAAVRHPRQERRVLRGARLDAVRHRPLRARRHVRAGARAARGRGRRRARDAARRRSSCTTRSSPSWARCSACRRSSGAASTARPSWSSERSLIGVGLAVAAWRVRIARSVSDDPRGRLADLPRPLPLQLEGRGAGVPGGRQSRRRANVDASTPVVYLLFDEFPVIDLMNEQRADRRGALPQFRSARAHVDLVPQHDDALRRPRRSPCP